MRRPLLSVSAAALGLVVAATAPAAAGPIGLLPGAGSTTAAAATSTASAPGIERVVFLLDGGSGFSGVWSGSGGASICIGCFVGTPPWDSGVGNAFGFGGQGFGRQPGFGVGTAPGAGGGGAAGLTGQVSLPDLLPPASGHSFTLPFELFGTLNGYNIFGQGQLLFTSGPGGGLAAGAPFQSSEAPEPASLLLLSTGASALFLSARRRRRGSK